MYFLPKKDVSLPVFQEYTGRVLFESPIAQAEFIRNEWSKKNGAKRTTFAAIMKIWNRFVCNKK